MLFRERVYDMMPVLPKSLRSLDWKPMDSDREWFDGQILLVAMPVMSRGDKVDTYHYRFHVIEIHNDSEYFSVTEAEEPWEFGLDDCDLFVSIN